jgi:hypothetical protein
MKSNNPRIERTVLPALLAAGLLTLATVQRTSAAEVLTDGNSVATVDPFSQAGMFSWKVQGQEQLHQQWFWFRVGNTAEHSIDTISAPVVQRPNPRSMTTTYGNAQYNIRLDYTLSGGSFVAPGQTAVSDMGESITINNTSGESLDFHFFQYSDFDLGGPGNDNIRLGRNLHGLFNEAAQTDPFAGITETVVSPGANHGEVAFFNTTLTKLNDGVADTLNDNDGGPNGLGPGNVTWALQWDILLAPGASAIISKDKYLQVQIVPEPSVLALLGVAVLGCAVRQRRLKS